MIVTDLPTATGLPTSQADQETFVTDGRAGLTPSEQIEQRLTGLLGVTPLTVSQPRDRLRPAFR